jgi:hypothetical protein
LVFGSGTASGKLDSGPCWWERAAIRTCIILAWESLAERETKWNKFASDPDWLAKRTESERDGPIVASITNMFLQPTAFSAVK